MTLRDAGISTLRLTSALGSSVNKIIESIPTPSSLEELDVNPAYGKPMDLLDRAFSVEVSRWGTIFGYKQEQKGRKIQNLFPIKKHEGEQISSSSKVILEMHTETAFHPYRPDVLALFCVRGDPNAGTTFATLSDILQYLDEETKNELRQENFTAALDASFINEDDDRPAVRTSVLQSGDKTLVFDKDSMKGLTPAADEALHKVVEAVSATKKTIYLESGQILAINNHTVVHGRTPFTPRYDGTDRWLKRALIRREHPPQSDIEWNVNHFVITTDF